MAITVIDMGLIKPTLLVANRGEIALRIMRTARRMGLSCLAVYSDADSNEPFVRFSDRSFRLGGPSAEDSYLSVERIIEAARVGGAQLVHPGYGFLSEAAHFAEACSQAGLIFVGPPPEVLALAGDKAAAKQMAEEAGVPVFPGVYLGDELPESSVAFEAAERVGYPVMVKPVNGGGGKGMVVVEGPGSLEAALASARRIAISSFGDGSLMLERYVSNPRHIEVQVIADNFGNVFHLGERDCTIQRRHQKILEESPSPAVDSELANSLHEAAVRLAKSIQYRGAGTVEFLVAPDGSFGFIEMNARLQVEHPVTELVRGVDLVELQLRVAMGEELTAPLGSKEGSSSWGSNRPHGHAVEVRVYAEDSHEGFLPQTGKVLHLRWGGGVRVDAAVEEGSVVSSYYDPMIAKVIAWGQDRTAALDRLQEALSNTEILGVTTNLPFLRALVADSDVRNAQLSVSFLEDSFFKRWPPEAGSAKGDRSDEVGSGAIESRRAQGPRLPASIPEEVFVLAAAAEGVNAVGIPGSSALAGARPGSMVPGPGSPGSRVSVANPFLSLGPWRPQGLGAVLVPLHSPVGKERICRVRRMNGAKVGDVYEVRLPVAKSSQTSETSSKEFTVELSPGCHHFRLNDRDAAAVIDGDRIYIWWEGQAYELVHGISTRTTDSDTRMHLEAPLPGVVLSLLVTTGSRVLEGDPLVVIEAMKMEHVIRAPADGVVTAVTCKPGDTVRRGQAVADFEVEEADDTTI